VQFIEREIQRVQWSHVPDLDQSSVDAKPAMMHISFAIITEPFA
jgi:hypothetical protein